LTEGQAFGKGLTMGYQTMDLMAAFFFSSTTIYYLKGHLKQGDGEAKLVQLSLTASLIGAAILTLSYIGFMTLGAKYATALEGVRPEAFLAIISQQALGSLALPIVSFTMAISCLATAVILTLLFVNFLHQDIFQGRISEKKSMILTIGLTFVVSLLGFSKICYFLGEVLEMAYPALIVLALINIVNRLWNRSYGVLPFWLTLTTSILFKYAG
jgi:LIVCS family branched-chain amino acid:cation transporter